MEETDGAACVDYGACVDGRARREQHTCATACAGVATSRRRFVGAMAATVAVPYLAPGVALGLQTGVPASERITIGVIGVGVRGNENLSGLMHSPLAQVVALCDCHRGKLISTQQRVERHYAEAAGRGVYHGCKTYADFRQMLARADIDAVLVTSPDHWHGIHATEALKSGKDLYCEKPLGRTIAESIAIRNAAVRHARVFQTGTQQRSDARFRQACQLARGGYLGKIHRIEVAVPAGGDIPKQPPAPVPEGFDYDTWSGPAPLHPYDNRRCQWLAMYWIYDYCVGFICNWGIHHLDIAAWGCPEVVEAPFEVQGVGFLPTEGMCDTLVTWRTEFVYPSGLRMSFTSDRGPFNWQLGQGLTEQCRRVLEAVDPKLHHAIGCRFLGERGWVHVTRGAISADPPSLLAERIDPERAGIAISNNHYADFLEAVRQRREPVSPVESGHRATILGNAADIAVRLGRKLKWDWQQEHFIGDEQANRLLAQPMRPPWKLPL